MLRDVARPSKARIVLAVVVTLLLGVPLGIWLARDAIATSVALSELERRGLACDDRFSLSLSAGLSEATLGPTRCAHEGGLVEAVELLGDVNVPLEGFAPARVDAESVRLTLRDRDVRGGSRWASELRRLSLEQQVAGIVKGLSEVSRLGLPPTSIGRLEVVRSGEPVARGTSLVMTPEGWGVQLGARDMTFPARVGRLVLTHVTGHAEGGEVTLSGRATAEAGIGILAFSRGGAFELTAVGLDGDSPRFALSGDF